MATDYHSYSNPDEVIINHIDLDLSVNFQFNQLIGSAILSFTIEDDSATKLILDTRDIFISDVELVSPGNDWISAAYEIKDKDQELGSALVIDLPNDKNSFGRKLKINYKTSRKASGLQWLTPQQTAGKKHPFLFSQSQAIHARSWVPLQDSPQVRFTYEATLKVPDGLLAVMSASNEFSINKDGVYKFTMPQAISSYLLAIAVGELEFKPIGKRTGVYAEPYILDAAAAEFEDTEKMLETSEQLYGPYRWERYDLLILPASFPFGGMENPRLSFITPTVISGDKSLVSLVAHELAHSWSGNLVTNATWCDLWLNEGFTTYVESRIMEVIYSKERAAMENVLDYNSLLELMETLPDTDQRLNADLRGRDPDEAFTRVPYVKGKLFLTFLEAKLGRDIFDEFILNYFEHFTFQTITTNQFLKYLKTNLIDQHSNLITWNEIEEWVFHPGLPKSTPIPKSNAFEDVDNERGLWLNGKSSAAELNTKNWTVHQWIYFLNRLPQNLSIQQLEDLDKTFKLTQSSNDEIAHVWLLISILHDYKAAYQRLEEYIISIGRRKLVIPLFKALLKSPDGQKFATTVFEKARIGYHPLTISTVESIFQSTDLN